jgi:hypothetical protein
LDACTVSGNVGGNGSSADASSADIQRDFIWYARFGGSGGAGGTGGVYGESSVSMTLCTLSGNIGGAGGSGGASWGGFPFENPIPGGAGGPGGQGAVCGCESTDFALIACTIGGNSGGSGGTGGPGGGIGYSGRTYIAGGGGGGAGGILIANAAGSGSLINTLVASNLGGVGGAGASGYGAHGPQGLTGVPDLAGFFSSLGHNLIGRTDDSSGFTNGVNGDLVGSGSAPIDPLLGPLTDNGGPSPTMALLHGSPALDAGDDAILHPPYHLRDDQRGFPRQSASHVDIGAFEFQYQGYSGQRSPSGPGPTLSATLGTSGNGNGNSQSESVSKGSDPTTPAAANVQLTFSDNVPGATFSVLATTNVAMPFENWRVIGQPIQIGPGVFQLTDLQVTNYPQRFYRVSSP